MHIKQEYEVQEKILSAENILIGTMLPYKCYSAYERLKYIVYLSKYTIV